MMSVVMTMNKEETYLKIYTPISQIELELAVRKNDSELIKKVKNFFSTCPFPPLQETPRAVLSRSIATPNMEMERFLSLAKTTNLEPLVLEYPDKFVARNSHKYHLCKLFFFRETLKLNRTIHTLKLVDFNKVEGKNLSEIKTLWGENIVSLHHHFLFLNYPNLHNQVLNFTSWFKKTRVMANEYYLYYLALFVTNGVLFENFLFDDKEEEIFFKEKFLPSFKKIEEIFGVKPLIAQLLPTDDEKSTFWYSYPEKMRPILLSQVGLNNAIIDRWSSIISKILNTAMKLFRRSQTF